MGKLPSEQHISGDQDAVTQTSCFDILDLCNRVGTITSTTVPAVNLVTLTRVVHLLEERIHQLWQLPEIVDGADLVTDPRIHAVA